MCGFNYFVHEFYSLFNCHDIAQYVNKGSTESRPGRPGVRRLKLFSIFFITFFIIFYFNKNNKLIYYFFSIFNEVKNTKKSNKKILIKKLYNIIYE